MKKIGFIGLGIMGKPMASNLVKAGVDLYVNDIDSDKVDELCALGAKALDSKDIGEECDIIFTILPNGKIVEDVFFGDEGINLSSGEKLVCDMSSVTPTESKRWSEKFGEMGIGFVDAPVSGGEPKAIDGTLAFMVGGSEDNFEKLKPYFEIMGDSAVLVGGAGAGSTAKLSNQIIVNLTISAVSEALVLAKKAGADPAKVYEAIRGGLAGSTVLDAKAPMMIERNFKPGGTIAINRKDINNVLKTAEDLDCHIPLTEELGKIMDWMAENDLTGEDHSALVKYFESIAGVEVK